MKVILKADGTTEAGGSALIQHNERLSDPLDEFTQHIAETSKKRNKTQEDHRTMAHGEFGGGLYTTPCLTVEDFLSPNGQRFEVCVPAWNMLRCLQEGATRHKLGKDVLRGVYPLVETVPLQYEGPSQPHELWTDGGFALRKGVGVGGRKVMRTRPVFSDWEAELPVEVDMTIFDLHSLRKCWKDAGTYVGLGDMRPIYGRFAGAIEEVTS